MLSAPLPTTQYISEQTSTAAIGAHLVADRHNKVNSDLKYCSRSLKEEATQCVRRQYNLSIVSYYTGLQMYLFYMQYLIIIIII